MGFGGFKRLIKGILEFRSNTWVLGFQEFHMRVFGGF